MTDARKALADAIRSGELELVFCHPEGKFPALPASQEQRDIVEAALRSPLPGTREEVAREPVAWMVRDSINGNVRLWSQNSNVVESFANKKT